VEAHPADKKFPTPNPIGMLASGGPFVRKQSRTHNQQVRTDMTRYIHISCQHSGATGLDYDRPLKRTGAITITTVVLVSSCSFLVVCPCLLRVAVATIN
jgi:hypothetical protein